MIGMIALAGIIVRNSILLVDFIQLAEARGRTLRDAVLEAGAVRFRPIALTAAAVVVGGLVMVLDPIFQGLAVALMSGAVVATLLTMVWCRCSTGSCGRDEGASHQSPPPFAVRRSLFAVRCSPPYISACLQSDLSPRFSSRRSSPPRHRPIRSCRRWRRSSPSPRAPSPR
jgi:hypothetical protein